VKRVVVVGGGLSGLAAAHEILAGAEARGLPVGLELLEAETRTGGKIGTRAAEGYRCELGPNGFLDNSPPTLGLVERLGLSARLLPSNDAARRRYLFLDGRLRALPESPPAFLRSDVVSLPGKLRIAAELIVPRRVPRPGEDETLAAFVRRRLGREALEKLIDPMASGIYAGDPENMSVASCFPKIVALERAYGGLIRGMIAKQREARRAGADRPAGGGPGGKLLSFVNGLRELVDALAARLGERVRTGAPATAVAPAPGGGCTVLAADGTARSADAVVLAVPAYAASEALAAAAPEVSDLLRRIPYPPMAVVHFGIPERDLGRPLDGFGFLVPHRERRRILGALWSSSIFDHRAPAGAALLTMMVGGALDTATPLRPDPELAGLVHEELRDTMGQLRAPAHVRITRWERAIPQYVPGHAARLAEAEERLRALPGVFLAGNAYRGIGVNDCVRAAGELAPRVLNHLSGPG